MKALVKGFGGPALAITSVTTIARGFASALDYYRKARELKLEIYRMNKESEIILEKIEKALQMQIAQMENIQHNYQQYTQNNRIELQNCNTNISEYGIMLQKISREMTLPNSSVNEITHSSSGPYFFRRPRYISVSWTDVIFRFLINCDRNVTG